MSRHRIAVIPGDGIGQEVVPEGIRVVEAAARRHGIELDWEHFPWSCETYRSDGWMMPPDGLDRLEGFDAIFLGAVGFPGVPDHVSLWGLLIPIRRHFRQYVNLRPVRVLAGMVSPLRGRGPEDIDFYVVRENNEGEYSEIGGRLYEGTDREMVMQESVFTRQGVDRVLAYAFELARSREAKHLTSATKSNGIIHTMPYWDERFAAMAARYEDVRTSQYHVDILAANFVLHPDWFDVVVGSNLFGDILSDLGPAIAGTIGVAPSANINPERDCVPRCSSPCTAPRPDIAGRGIANPIGQIWSGAMMLDHLGHPRAAAEVVARRRGGSGRGRPPGPRTSAARRRTADLGRAVEEALGELTGAGRARPRSHGPRGSRTREPESAPQGGARGPRGRAAGGNGSDVFTRGNATPRPSRPDGCDPTPARRAPSRRSRPCTGRLHGARRPLAPAVLPAPRRGGAGGSTSGAGSAVARPSSWTISSTGSRACRSGVRTTIAS